MSFRWLMLLVLMLAPSCVSFSAIKAPATPIVIHRDPDALIGKDKLVLLRSFYRGRSMDILSARQIAENELLTLAAADGKDAVFVDFEGQRTEAHAVGTALFSVIEATSVELLGQRNVVAESVKDETSPKVLAALHQRLL
jgi:hypothetical protein